MHQQMMQGEGGMGHGMARWDARRHGQAWRMHGQQSGAAGTPTMPGQDAFGTIQEVVEILQADPATDWSKVEYRRVARASDRHERGDAERRGQRAHDRQRHRDRGHRRRPHAGGDQAHGAGACPASSPRSAGTPRREDLPNGVKLTVMATDAAAAGQAQGARLHGHHGAGRPSSAASPHDGERRNATLSARRSALAAYAPPNLARSCGAAKSSCGPTGTMPVGFTWRWLP